MKLTLPTQNRSDSDTPRDIERVPVDWRRQNMTPIFKKGKKCKAGNYRPVSLTSRVCKVMESIWKDEIMAHFERNILILESQHGFVPGKSVLINLIMYIEDLIKMLDDGLPVDVIYLDECKAFDCVLHKRLEKKMEAHGIGPKYITWTEAWLKDRKHRIVINGKQSTWTDVKKWFTTGNSTRTTENSASTTGNSARTTENSARTTENSASTTENSARTTENSARTTENSASTTENSARTTENSARTTENSASTTENSARTTENSARTTENSARTTENSARTTENSARTTENSASTTENSARTTENSARTTENSASTTENSARTTENSARTTENSASTTENSARTTENTHARTHARTHTHTHTQVFLW